MYCTIINVWSSKCMTWCACPLCFSRIYLIKLTFCRVKYVLCLLWLSTEISHSKKLSCAFCNIIRGIETTTTSQKYLKQEIRAGLDLIQKLCSQLGAGTRSRIQARLSRMNIYYARTSKLVSDFLYLELFSSHFGPAWLAENWEPGRLGSVVN